MRLGTDPDEDIILKLIEIFAERVADRGGSVTLVKFGK